MVDPKDCKFPSFTVPYFQALRALEDAAVSKIIDQVISEAFPHPCTHAAQCTGEPS